MDHFNYHDGQLYAENVAVIDIIAEYGTPCYIYSRATIERHWQVMNDVCGQWPHQICYAVKANDNLAVLDVLTRLGSGFDLVSQGELERVLHVGGDPNKIVFSGVGKLTTEIQRALQVGIHCFNIESADELTRIQQCAQSLNIMAPIAVRINPNVDANTHPYIATGLRDSKFGVAPDVARQLYQRAQQLSHIDIVGITCHIGSQLASLTPFTDAMRELLTFVDELQGMGITLQHIDMGGGLGVPYRQDEQLPTPAEYTQALIDLLADRQLTLLLEPGRLIMANAGILVSRVEYIKTTDNKRFAIIDAGMNDLLRPALYQAWHDVIPVQQLEREQHTYDIVGPVCETSDCFATKRELAIATDDYIAIRSVGAYGACMSSQYNARVRAAEVMVDDKQAHLIRRRETWDDLMRHETPLPAR